MINIPAIKLSIITINLNNTLGLEKTIKSVKSQTYRAVEFIIIDGASTDGSIELIKNYSDDITFWLSEKDSGIYDAMNKGILNAKGEYLMFLNSGDSIWSENVLHESIEEINRRSDVDVFYGDIVSGSIDNIFAWKHPQNLDISFLKTHNLNHQSSFLKARLFKDYGLYPEKYKLAGDHWIYLVSMVNDRKFLPIESLQVNCQPDGVGVTQRANYEKEMAQMWLDIVPHYVDNLVGKYAKVNYAENYPYLKKIIPIDLFLTYKKKQLLGIVTTIAAIVAALIFFFK